VAELYVDGERVPALRDRRREVRCPAGGAPARVAPAAALPSWRHPDVSPPHPPGDPRTGTGDTRLKEQR
jgi:hypothetical protein